MAADNNVNIVITAVNKASAILNQVSKDATGMGSGVSNALKNAEDASKKFMLGITAVGAAVAAFGINAVAAAGEAQAKIAQMDATLATMGKTGMAARGQILAAADATTKLGFDNEASAVSISKLYQATGNVNQAIKLNNLAMDVSRDKHIGLEDATKIVQLALAGNTRALKAYNIELKDGITPMEALEELQKRVAGQADAFARTVPGQWERFKQVVGDINEAIGDRLIPFVLKLSDAFFRWVDSMGGAEGIANRIFAMVQSIAPYIPFIAAGIAGALVPALWGMASALAANIIELAPFAAAGIAVAAIGAALYYAYQYHPVIFWAIAGAVAAVAGVIVVALMPALIAQAAAWTETAIAAIATYAPIIAFVALFAAVGAAAGALGYAIYTNAYGIRDTIVAVWNAIVEATQQMFGIMGTTVTAGLGALLGFFVDIFKALWKVVVDVFSGVGETIVGVVAFLLAFFTGAGKDKMDLAWAVMFGGIENILIGIMNGLITIVESGINHMIDVIQAAIDKLKKLPVIGAQFSGINLEHVTLPRITPVDTTVPGGLASFIGDDLKKTLSDAFSSVKGSFSGILGSLVPDALGGAGGGGAGSDDASKKLQQQIEQNINDLTTKRQDAASSRQNLQKEVDTINEELAREKHDGVKQNQALIDKRTAYQKQISSLDTQIAQMDSRLASSNEDLAAEKRKQIAAADAQKSQQTEFETVNDLIDAQKLSESDAAAAKAKADADKKKREAEAKKNASSSTSSSSISIPTIPDLTPTTTIPDLPAGISSALPSLSGAQQASVNAGGIVLLDLNGSGDKTYNIYIEDNSFYGDDPTFAQKIADKIYELVKPSLPHEAF